MMAEDIPLCIIYEDDAVLIINKEANMSTIPSREHPAGSVANALLSHYDKQRSCKYSAHRNTFRS